MSLVKKVYLFLFFIGMYIFFIKSITYANSNLSLLSISCDGELGFSLEQRIPVITKKTWLGDVPRGFLYKKDFFYIDNNQLIDSNLLDGKSIILADLKKFIDKNYMPWQIGYVDDNLIYISAILYNKNVSIEKQKKHSLIYRFDRSEKKMFKISMTDCESPYFSMHKDKIYYTNSHGEISEFAEGTTTLLGFKGDYPSVSPDGKKLAFSSFMFINNHVYVYDVDTKEKTSVISFLGPRGLSPIIRWSKDSKNIAVKKKSDLMSGPLYVVNILSKNIAKRFNDSHACNWFFIDN